MTMGRRLGIDFGLARIGLATSSVDGLFCSPLDTVANDGQALATIVRHVSEINPIIIYVGLPLNLQGEHTPSTANAVEFAKQLAAETETPVRMIDERLTTREAQGQLFLSGKNSRTSKSLIDAAAASLILEHALAIEKSRGIAGEPITEFE